MSSSTTIIAGSVLVGSLMIAVAIWMSRPAPVGHAQAPSVAAPALVGGGPDPAAQAEQDASVRAHAFHNATRALSQRRAELVKACWEPVAGTPGPAEITLTFVLSFGADGRLLGTGVVEHREAHRAEVATCIRQRALELSIAAPGRSLQLEVPLTLP